MKHNVNLDNEEPKVIAKKRTNVKNNESEESGVETVSKGNLYIIGGVAAAVGFWALACLASAVMNSEGAFQIFHNWLSALSGI